MTSSTSRNQVDLIYSTDNSYYKLNMTQIPVFKKRVVSLPFQVSNYVYNYPSLISIFINKSS